MADLFSAVALDRIEQRNRRREEIESGGEKPEKGLGETQFVS